MSYSYHSQSWAREQTGTSPQSTGWLGAILQVFVVLNRIQWTQPWDDRRVR